MCRKFIFLVSFVLVLGLASNASALIYAEKSVGDPPLAGSATYDDVNDQWTVIGSGHDIWDESDGFHYVYRPLNGNGVMDVNLASMTSTDGWQKVGLMIRETTDAGSKHFIMAVSGTHGIQACWRTETNEGTDGTATEDPEHVLPQALRIKREGSLLTGQYWGWVLKPIKRGWKSYTSQTISMNDPVYIGMVVCSHNNDLLCTAVFDDVVWPVEVNYEPWDMSPADGADKVDLVPTLTWMPGDTAATHEVWFGTEGAMELVATKDLGDESYTPDTPLAKGTVYYWQIVEQPGDYAGPVYSFTTYVDPTGITREVWEGIGGTDVPPFTALPEYPCCPTWSDKLPSMASYDFADNYGAHMQGRLWPETGGDYTFWIAADDSTELWLSTDEDPGNLTKIAEHVGWTNAHNWYDTPEQQSAPITLVGGQMYFIRAIWKEGGGGDNCQVAWQGPDQPDAPVQGNGSAIITGYYFPPVSLQPELLGPADGITLTPLEATLSWLAIRGATYEVYFGEDGGSMALIASGLSGLETSVSPPVEVGKTYNWKVNYVYDTDVLESDVRSFSVEEWVSIDIGRANPDPAGSSSVEDGVYTLKTTGAFELWGQSDEFHYLYTTMKMTRDIGSITARVLSIDAPDSWRRAGVMIRETTAANSRKVMAHKTGHDNTRMQWREQPGWDTWNTGDNWGLGFPKWVRVTRNGEQYNGYRSEDGVNWTHLGGMWCPMQSGNYVCVGLALCHHPSQPADQFTTGMFDNLSITTPDTRQSWGPSPGDGEEGVPIYPTLSWTAGEGAVEQHLYFSENYADVEDGTAYIGEFDPDVTEWTPGTLDLTKTYYWAVDTDVRVGRDYETILGEIWSFTIEEFLVIEDFEAYDDPPAPLEELPAQEIVGGDYTIPGYTITAVPPDDTCLVAHYEFEGNCNDSSGNGHDGTIIGDVNNITFEDEPNMGMVLSLPGGDNQFVEIGAVGISGNDPTTISCWAKADHTSIPDWSLVLGFTGTADGSGGCGSHFNIGSIGGPGGVGAHAWCFESTIFTDEEALEWRHYAMTFDGTTIKYYGDGDQIGQTDMDLSIRGDRVHIGSRVTQASSFPGKVDDARIYDCALSYGEVRYMADAGNLVVDPIYVPPTYGPMIAEYLAEGNADDTSGNELHGTPLGDATIVDDADLESLVASFDGGGDAVDLGNSSLFNPGYDDFSISVWINMSSYGGNWGNVIVGKRGEGGLGWQLRRLSDTQRISFTTRNCGDQDGWGPGGQNISLNEWHHVAAVRDGTEKCLYIDGQQEAVSGICDYIEECDHNVYIGARANGDNTGPEAFFNGKIDELRLYNCALTWGQVLNLLGYEIENSITDTWSGIEGAPPILEYQTANWGDLSMRMEYDNSQYVYQALYRRDAPFADWTAGNAKALSMWFRGDPGNAADLVVMYVTLRDDSESASVYYDGDDWSDLNKAEWQEWNIALGDFAGVNVDSISDIGVGVVGLGAGSGRMYFDDMRLYPTRCIPEYGPVADFTGDCIVDGRDLRVHAGEWMLLAELPAQEWDRVAYYDGRYPTGWADTAVAEGVRDYLSTAGYTVVDADQLKTWMDARIADGALSVVVMCQDIAPDTVTETRDADCTLRKYLDAGGKVVQYADIPFYNQGHADGTTTNWATDGSVYILGFNAAGAGWDSGNTVTITDAGANWGLTQTWPSNRPAAPGDVDTILATDDDGDASAWAKRYVPGDNCRGFVYIADFDPGSGEVALLSPALQSVAEYKADSTLVTDLYEDGAVNLKDYATIAEEWLVEKLFP